MPDPIRKLFQKPSIAIASSNYTDYSSIESINVGRVSVGTSFGGTFSADFGANTKFNDETSTKPFFEAKYQQKLGETTIFNKPVSFKGYLRYRNRFDDFQQVRVATVGNMAINDKLSLETFAHCSGAPDGSNLKTGFGVGASYKFNDNLSAWTDLYQMNVNLDGSGKVSHMTNFGITYKF